MLGRDLLISISRLPGLHIGCNCCPSPNLWLRGMPAERLLSLLWLMRSVQSRDISNRLHAFELAPCPTTLCFSYVLQDMMSIMILIVCIVAKAVAAFNLLDSAPAYLGCFLFTIRQLSVHMFCAPHFLPKLQYMLNIITFTALTRLIAQITGAVTNFPGTSHSAPTCSQVYVHIHLLQQAPIMISKSQYL